MAGEYLGVALSGQNATHDLKPSLPGEIGEHRVKLGVHLGQRLLHALNAGRCFLHQGLALAQVRTQRHDRGGSRTETGPQRSPYAMQFAQPFAVADVALAPGHIVHVAGDDQHRPRSRALPESRKAEASKLRSIPSPPS